jgi:sporulation related protein
MDSGLLGVNPDQTKRLLIAPEITCPKCKSRVVFRTKRKGFLERIVLYPLGYRAYQCEYCLKRFCSRNKSAQAVLVSHTTGSVRRLEPETSVNKASSRYNTPRHLIWFFLGVLLISAAVLFLRHYARRAGDNRRAIVNAAAGKAPVIPPPISPVEQPASALPAALSSNLPGFMLQVAAMKHEENALALSETLHQNNFPVFVFKRGAGPFYLVAVGVYGDADSALRVKDELERQGFKAFLRRWTPE